MDMNLKLGVKRLFFQQDLIAKYVVTVSMIYHNLLKRNIKNR